MEKSPQFLSTRLSLQYNAPRRRCCWFETVPFPYLAVTKLTSNAPENLFALNVPLPEYQIYTAGIYAVLNYIA